MTAPGGVVDVLYRDVVGEWQIVDFKTDALARSEDAEPLIRTAYGPQLRRYLRAAAAFLERPACARLCWLDCAGRVEWQVIAADSETPDRP